MYEFKSANVIKLKMLKNYAYCILINMMLYYFYL